MKKILYLHTGAELYGADNILLTLLNEIDRKKFYPVVILPANGLLVDRLKKINITVEVIDYPILRRQYFTVRGIIDYLKNYLSACKEIIEIAVREDIDLIHVNTIAVLEGIYVSKKIKKPLLWHVHEILEKPKIVYKFTSILIGRYATRVVAVSDAVKKHLVESNFIKEDKIQVIYNGVDEQIYNKYNEINYLRNEFNIPVEDFVVGMIGRVNAIKGQKDFLRICVPLIKKYKNVTAIMVGGVFPGQEWRFEELKKEIADTGVQEKIRLIDYRMDSANFHNLFDVYVLPSIHADSLPTVVLEAMASEKVVVGYKCGGIVEMVDDRKTGYLEEIGKYKELSADIENLIMNNEIYQNMAIKGYQKQRDFFSVNRFRKSFEALYDSIVNEEI